MSMPLMAQQPTNVKPISGGRYTMDIGGKNYLAMSFKQVEAQGKKTKALEQQLKETQEKLKEYKDISDRYDVLRENYVGLTDEYKGLSDNLIGLNQKYSNTANGLVGVNNKYKTLVADYDELAEKYRGIALRSRARSKIDIGVGRMNSANISHTVFMAGVGTSLIGPELRMWAFGGEDTIGFMVGGSFF